ncbi:putative aMP-dependent synthetase and ligase [Mycobacterium xenopi 4042]|uniref:Putative aMP-dependent synthetase and ligase n=1 Tax=Mycobacterium xenopi 4042 TaxID=1299334 RepID=X8AIN8_MYCXE|nr:putative aMP-dependent synthetase and ligase [Mycobacterium xenopi 4042]
MSQIPKNCASMFARACAVLAHPIGWSSGRIAHQYNRQVAAPRHRCKLAYRRIPRVPREQPVKERL